MREQYEIKKEHQKMLLTMGVGGDKTEQLSGQSH
jgi:hypothetical protein